MVKVGQYSKPQRSKKNKKIKAIDPFYTGDRVADRLQLCQILYYREAEKFNQAPKETDGKQEFSRRFQEIARLKTLPKTMKRKRRKHSEKTFKRMRGETDEAFLNRVDRLTEAVIQRAQFEDKYGLNESDVLKNEKKVKGKGKKNETSDRTAKKKSRLMEKRKKILLKKINKREDQLEKDLANPLLCGDTETESTWKPGQQANSRNQEPREQTVLSRQQKQAAHELKQREVGKTIKSKHLSIATREALEKERENAIKLYRQRRQRKQFLEVDAESE